MSPHTSTHQFRPSASSFFFFMKQNNNCAGQLITLLFSINLHYCLTQELPLCQRRDSIKRLPEQRCLPCIPKSDTFGSTKHHSSFLRWSPSPQNVSPTILQNLLEESTAEVSLTALMNPSSLILYLDRDHVITGQSFALQVIIELSFGQFFTNSI